MESCMTVHRVCFAAGLAAWLMAGPAGAGTFTNINAVAAFGGSSTDAIHRRTPTVFGGLHNPSYATDGLPMPMEAGYCYFYSAAGTNQWELGGDLATRRLTRVDIWLDVQDSARRKYHFQIAVSSNGVDFATVGDSGFQTPASASNHLARFSFDSAETLGCRYVRVIFLEPLGYCPRFQEIDVFTTGDPFFATPVDTFGGATNNAILQQYPWPLAPGMYKPLNLTDGLSSGGYTYPCWYGSPGTNVFILGAPCATRRLTGVDIWTTGTESVRRRFRFQILVSSNGTDYARVADSGLQPGFDATNIVARFRFDDPETTRGVRYVGIAYVEPFPGVRLQEINVFTEGDPVTVSMTPEPLNQATDDLLAGRTGVFANWTYKTMRLNDATGPATPDAATFGGDNNTNVTATFDLGWRPDRYLARVDVWTPAAAFDPARDMANIKLCVSPDNAAYTEIANGGVRWAVINQTNRLSFIFQRQAVRNWRYFRLYNGPAHNNWYSGAIIEVDVFAEAPKGSVLICR